MLSFVPNAQGPNLYPTLHLCTMNHSPPSPTGSTDLTLHHFQQRSRSSTFRVFLKPIMSLSLPAATSTLHTTNKSIYYYLPSPRLFSCTLSYLQTSPLPFTFPLSIQGPTLHLNLLSQHSTENTTRDNKSSGFSSTPIRLYVQVA